MEVQLPGTACLIDSEIRDVHKQGIVASFLTGVIKKESGARVCGKGTVLSRKETDSTPRSQPGLPSVI